MSETSEIDISPVIEAYEGWKDVDGVSEFGQGLHPAVINQLDWKDGTAKKIAEFALSQDKKGVQDWLDDRKSLYHLENSEYYKRVHEVRREITKILRNQKLNSKILGVE